MANVDVFLSHGFPQVWPPVVGVDARDNKITFCNATGDDMRVELAGVPLPAGSPTLVTVPKKAPNHVKDVLVDTSKAPGAQFEYHVLCGPAGAQQARGLSHPIIIIR